MFSLAALVLALSLPHPGGAARVDVSVATLWSSPAAPHAVVTQALYGETVRVLAVQGAWAKVAVPDQPSPLDRRGYPGWVLLKQLRAGTLTGSSYLVLTSKRGTVRAGGRTIQVSYGTRLPAGSRLTAGDWRKPPRASGASIVADAKMFVGLRYLWGGTSSWGFDCSGLVWDVFRAHGVVVPRDAAPQSRGGRWVSPHALRPGDLVFYGAPAYHVAIFAGGGKMVESPDSRHAVRVVPLRPGFSAARRYTQ